jgi:enoyl-CoA hydratase
MIEVTHHGDVACLHMRHGKVNALDVELCQDLIAHLQACATSQARAVVLTGQGTVFSAGVDLLRVLNEGAPYLQVFLPALCQTFETLFFHPQPVIAAINGHAIAGGCVLACAADHRVMAHQSGRIGVPELLVGVPFPTAALEILRFATAPQHLQHLLYSGTTFWADEAQHVGLIDEIVAPQALMERAMATAHTFAGLPPAAFALTKRQLRRPVFERLLQTRPDVEATVDALWMAPETLHTMRAYVARTFKPG